jgi:NAD-dependent dihydropyrimidine dehydrogenase PreA subunit
MTKKVKRKIIEINEEKCNGCGLCIPSCPEQALQIVETKNGPKVRLVKELYCDGLGACLGNCPTGALKVIEREAEEYDDAATIERIKKVAPEMLDVHIKHMQEHGMHTEQSHQNKEDNLPCGCPGTLSSSWTENSKKIDNQNISSSEPITIKSQLTNWPIQLNLINTAAPYLQNADIVIAADCTAFSYGNFHNEFIKGKILIIACPKLDDTEFYKSKLLQLFKTSNIKSVTVINMEVPCCLGLQHLVKEAIKSSNKKIPYCDITIGIKGNIVS